MPHWLLNYHPAFEENFEKWLYAYDHLRAQVYDQEHGNVGVIDAIVPDGLKHHVGIQTRLKRIERDYLIQKEQGELNAAYREREKISSYTPHFPFAVTSLAGMFFDAQPDLTPTWEPEDATEGLESSFSRDVTGQLEQDFDGDGNSLEAWLWDTAVQMTAMGTVWPRVEGVVRSDEQVVEEAAVVTETPLHVENWLRDGDRLSEVKLRTTIDDRDSLRDLETEARDLRHLVYDRQGWERFRLAPDTSASDAQVGQELDAEQGYEFWRSEDRRRRILPIFRADLPLRGNPGYNSARDANTIFNLESALDFELWYSSFAKFMADVETDDGLNEDLWDELRGALRDGENVLPGAGHEYKAPPSTNAEVKMKRLKQKAEGFYKTFFQRFGDAAKQKTATQVRQEARSGVQAFLTLLAYSLENLMQEVLWRIEQVYFPESPSLWGQASWTASTDFDPVDVEARASKMVEKTFPREKVPLTRSMATDVVRRYADAHDLEADEEEIEAAVDTIVSRTRQADSATRDFGL